MQAHIGEMAALIGPRCALIEPGAGSGIKTRMLLEALDDPVAYIPLDISKKQLLETAQRMAADFPQLEVAPVCADGAIAGDPKTRADADLAAWNNVLQGAAETVTASGTKVGGLLGARGCITRNAATGVIRVSVAWQGMAPTVASADTCATTLYGANDALRRVVFTEVVVPVLTVVNP